MTVGPHCFTTTVTRGTCTECDRPHYARGWCRTHYNAMWREGKHTSRPRTLVDPTATMNERLRHIGWTVTPGGCWEWNGSRTKLGYGQLASGTFAATGKATPVRASRAAFETWVRPLEPGEAVCHRCDNPPCINPGHLFVGTVRENNADKTAKGRQMRGTMHPHHKLSDDQVLEIRARYAAGGVRQADLAGEFGVCQQLVSGVVRGHRWAGAER